MSTRRLPDKEPATFENRFILQSGKTPLRSLKARIYLASALPKKAAPLLSVFI